MTFEIKLIWTRWVYTHRLDSTCRLLAATAMVSEARLVIVVQCYGKKGGSPSPSTTTSLQRHPHQAKPHTRKQKMCCGFRREEKLQHTLSTWPHLIGCCRSRWCHPYSLSTRTMVVVVLCASLVVGSRRLKECKPGIPWGPLTVNYFPQVLL